MLRDLVKTCTMSATNAGPSSLWIVNGRPNQGTVSRKRTLANSCLCFVLVRKASTHPEYTHVLTRRCLNALLGCVCVKSISGSSEGLLPSSGHLAGAAAQIEH